MPLNKLKTESIEIDAITADLLATGSITLADINDGEITAAKLHQSGATDGQTLIWVNANGQWEPGAGGGGGSMSDLVDDTTPQLGGNLDVNGKSITASSGQIEFEIANHKSFVVYDSYLKIDADNNYSAGINFIRDKATPANGDVLGYMFAQGRDSGNQLQSFARIDLNSEVVNAGSERGSIVLRNIVGGSYEDFFKADAQLMQNILYKDIKADIGVRLIFEGATANTYETILTVIDPTADRFIEFADASGTVVTTGNADAGATSTSSSDADHILISDGGVLKKITPADLGIGGPSTAYAKYIYEISSTVTSVSGADVNGNTLSYTAGNNVVEVFVNGVKQQEGTGKDYQATTGNSVVFASNLYSGDLVDIIAYNMFDANVLDINTVLTNENLGGDPANDNGNLIISHGATGQPMTSIGTSAINNIAIGNQNLTNLVDGDDNIAIGKLNLAANNGSSNLAIGNNVLRYGASHSQNTLLGMYNSHQSNASGFYRNTFVGYGGGYSINTGDYNTSIGSYARAYYNNTSYSTAIGYAAIPGFNHCTNVGSYSGASMYGQSDYCTLIGNYAGYDMDGGDRATYIGYRAGYGGGSAMYNTAVGTNSLYNISSGERNTAIGDAAGYTIGSGSNNVCLGQATGYSLTTGDQNTILGQGAGQTGTNNLVSGSNNTLIGYQAQGTSDSMSNTIVLGNASISSLQCNVQSISALSDERDKTDIQDLTLGLDFIKAMRPVQFTWNRRDGTLGTRKEVGFIAQELQEVEMDFNTRNRTHMVNDEDPSQLLAAPMQSYPILIKAIQELSAKVDSLQAEVNTLKNGG